MLATLPAQATSTTAMTGDRPLRQAIRLKRTIDFCFYGRELTTLPDWAVNGIVSIDSLHVRAYLYTGARAL